MNITEIITGLHPLEIKTIQVFEKQRLLWEDEIIGLTGLEGSQVSMAIGWLQTKGIISLITEESVEKVSLSEAGVRYARDKFPELRIIDWIRKNPEGQTIASIKELKLFDPEELSSAIGALKVSGAVKIVQGGILEINQDSTKAARFENIQKIIERFKDSGITDKEHAILISEIEPSEWILIQEYSKKRGGGKEPFKIYEVKNRRYSLTEGKEIILDEVKNITTLEEVSHLNPDMLKNGSWREKKFRKYNINLKPPRIVMGKKHPYCEFLDFVKYKLVTMGFEEMRGNLVENEFWDMDALYMPQFHPARDIHDVYFLKDPSHSKEIEEPFLTNVSSTHKDGWKTGSTGWSYEFDCERARRLILRSQGTAVSARKLAKISSNHGKYFSIARCFRYDQVDVTHATDFFQIEGIVIGEDINFRTLLGLLKLFAKEIAMAVESKFIPAYFPFTEPSVELHVKHPKLGWMELGGAGLFRPEVTIPLGIELPVIAWGLGLDRMAMVAMEIHDIRDLFSADLDFIRTKRINL